MDARWAASLLLPLVFAGCALTDGLDTGLPAPALAAETWLNTQGGEAIRLADLRGRHVLVEFWSASCPHCRKTIPDLQALADSYRGARLDVISVALALDLANPVQDPATVQAALDEHGATYPAGLDQHARAWTDYEFEYLPHAVLVDPEGRIAWSGSLSLHSAADVVADHVRRPRDSAAATVAQATPVPRGARTRCGTEPCTCPSQ